MKFILMDYVQENGWTKLSKAEQQQWLGAYQAFLDAIENAGVLKSSTGLENSSDAATVRTANSKSHVLDGPYSDSKEQLVVSTSSMFLTLTRLLRGQRVVQRHCTASSRYERSVTRLWLSGLPK